MSFLDMMAHLESQRPKHPPIAADGQYVKAGVPVGALPPERQSLPLPSDLTNTGDPVRSASNLEPIVRQKPRRYYEPPPPKPANWITLNQRLRDVPRTSNHIDEIRKKHEAYPDAALLQLDPRGARKLRASRGQGHAARAQQERVDTLELMLEQRRLDTRELEIRLSQLRQPPDPTLAGHTSASSIWPTLAPRKDDFSKMVAGQVPVRALVPDAGDGMPPEHLNRAQSLVLQAVTSAYRPAGKPQFRSRPYSYSSSNAATLHWGRPAQFDERDEPSPSTMHLLGLTDGQLAKARQSATAIKNQNATRLNQQGTTEA